MHASLDHLEADIEFLGGFVRQEGLDDEIDQTAARTTRERRKVKELTAQGGWFGREFRIAVGVG